MHAEGQKKTEAKLLSHDEDISFVKQELKNIKALVAGGSVTGSIASFSPTFHSRATTPAVAGTPHTQNDSIRCADASLLIFEGDEQVKIEDAAKAILREVDRIGLGREDIEIKGGRIDRRFRVRLTPKRLFTNGADAVKDL